MSVLFHRNTSKSCTLLKIKSRDLLNSSHGHNQDDHTIEVLKKEKTQSSPDPFGIVCDQHGHVAMLCGQEKPIGGTSLALGDHLILNDISMDRPFSAYKNG